MPVPILAGLNMMVTPALLVALILGALAHILWWAYGSLLNDYYDQDIDSQHPHGEKVFTMGFFSDTEKKRLVKAFAVAAVLLELPQVAYILAAHPNGFADAAGFAVVIGVGFVLCTGYSAPPLRTRGRLLGATYSLMFVFVIAFLRFAVLVGGLEFALKNWLYIAGICLFIYMCHGITSVALKDIPDAFSDRTGGVKSIPLVCGFRPALHVSILILVATMALGALYVFLGWVQWWFLLSYTGAIVYVFLFRETYAWILGVSADIEHWRKVPLRKTHHNFGYIVNWAVWIPCLMLAFNSDLLL